MKILLAGGGSGGPISPLLAVAAKIKKLSSGGGSASGGKFTVEFLFVGTRLGPDRVMVEPSGIHFISIPAAKWRRYFSIQNLFAPFILFFGFLKSLRIIKKFRPDVVFGAGSFVAVPIAWAARCFGVPIVIHQQDARIGLANRLITPFAKQITTAFEKTSKDFYSGSGLFAENLKPQAQWVGNPVRQEFLDNSKPSIDFFELNNKFPVLLVTGGGTGAGLINELIWSALPELVKIYQVIHITGKGKNKDSFIDPNYHPCEFLTTEMPDAMKIADIVISRAGLATISELSALGKVAIIIPMPGTHQDDNAKILVDRNAAVVLTRDLTRPEILLKILNKLKFDPLEREMLSKNMSNLMPHNAAETIAKIIINQKNEK